MASGMKCGSWESRSIRPIIRNDLEVLPRGWGGGLTLLTLPPEDWGESWKHEQAFRRGEATVYHFYREKGRYDMMCLPGRGPRALRQVVVDLYFASRDHAKHRRSYRRTCPGLSLAPATRWSCPPARE